MIRRRALLAAPAALLAAPAGAAPAGAPLGQPAGPVILTVTGAIAVRNAAGAAVFDLAMLDAMRQYRFHGETPWSRGPVSFTGPSLADLLALVGAKGRELHMHALNDYSAIVPIEDAGKWRVILATRRDGVVMTVRMRGPIWVIYPMDTHPELRNQAIYARSVWQLDRIGVV